MAQVTIRDLDDEVASRVRQAAAESKVSEAEMYRRLLTQAVGLAGESAIADAKAFREELWRQGWRGEDTVTLVRQAREDAR